MIKKPEILDKNPRHGSCDTLFNPKRPPFRPKEEGADHVRLEFPLAGVARKTLHLKVAGTQVIAARELVTVAARFYYHSLCMGRELIRVALRA